MLVVMYRETQAQNCTATKSTVKWKSPDSLFTVKVPRQLRLEKSSYPKEIKAYGRVVGKCVFVVYVIRLPADESKGSFSDKIDGLQFMLGGDDDHDFSEEMLNVQTFKAKKTLYAKQNTQGLLIDAGRYIFVLGFTSKNRSNLTSKQAKDFFESFRII